MGVRDGYKQTEVGLIPEDWNIKKIGDVCRLINGRGFKPYEWRSDGLPIIRIQNLNGSDDFNYYQGSYDKKIEIEDGQLLFAWSGSRGTSFGPHIWSGSLGLLNYHTWKIVIKENEVFSKFFLHALKQLTKFIEEKAHGASALVHTQKWEMEGFKFPLPTLRSEQEAIAKALSDVDALIESLEQLIEKKRHIKQGAMQELLTGKRRLPGFEVKKGYKQTEIGEMPEDWELKSIGSIATVVGGGTPSTSVSDYWNGDINWFTPTEIGRDKYVTTSKRRISEDGLQSSSAQLLPVGTILLTSRAGIGSLAILTLEACTNQGFQSLVSNENVNNEYLYYLMGTLKNVLLSNASGSTFLEITPTKVKSINIALPSKQEQEAIATILSDMDTELEALETKLEKTKQIKEGMMHELLTGRIRLI